MITKVYEDAKEQVTISGNSESDYATRNLFAWTRKATLVVFTRRLKIRTPGKMQLRCIGYVQRD